MAVATGAFEDSAASTVATYNCPVCRKAHVLDLDRLQVNLTPTPLPLVLSVVLRGSSPSQAVWCSCLCCCFTNSCLLLHSVPSI